jgi:tetratricopeptide (TPR) repeat protein
MRAVSSGSQSARAAAPPPALEELDRRLRWRFVPLLIFLAMMIGLAAAAAVSLLTPRRPVTGIPGDPDARAAFALVRSQAPPGMGALRFHSELTGESGLRAPPLAAGVADEAYALLGRAEARHPLDPRLTAARGHLDLARRRFRHAERGYRRALLLAPHYGEARLGLGAALALDAEREANPLEQRSLRLQAIAQFAAVPANDPVHAHALYDRAVLLTEVGRRAEAERHARDYLRGDGESAWAESLGVRMRAGR